MPDFSPRQIIMIKGSEMVVRPNPSSPSRPWAISKGESRLVALERPEDRTDWALKIPKGTRDWASGALGDRLHSLSFYPAFEAGRRFVLGPADFVSEVALAGSVLMPWVDGVSVEEAIESRRSGAIGPMGAPGVRCAKALCRAVGVMEKRGVFHGDLSGGNVLVQVERGSVAIVDLEHVQELGKGKKTVGTLGYVGPTGTALDDRFALGALVVEIVLLSMPSFSGDLVGDSLLGQTKFEKGGFVAIERALKSVRALAREMSDVVDRWIASWKSGAAPAPGEWVSALRPVAEGWEKVTRPDLSPRRGVNGRVIWKIWPGVQDAGAAEAMGWRDAMRELGARLREEWAAGGVRGVDVRAFVVGVLSISLAAIRAAARGAGEGVRWMWVAALFMGTAAAIMLASGDAAVHGGTAVILGWGIAVVVPICGLWATRGVLDMDGDLASAAIEGLRRAGLGSGGAVVGIVVVAAAEELLFRSALVRGHGVIGSWGLYGLFLVFGTAVVMRGCGTDIKELRAQRAVPMMSVLLVLGLAWTMVAYWTGSVIASIASHCAYSMELVWLARGSCLWRDVLVPRAQDARQRLAVRLGRARSR